MKIKVNIEELNYGDVAVQAMPIIRSHIEQTDDAMSAILLAVTQLPDPLVHQIFDTVSEQQKNLIVSLLVEENQQTILNGIAAFLDKNQIGVKIGQLCVTEQLEVLLDVKDIDYVGLIQRFLPLVSQRLEQGEGASGLLSRLTGAGVHSVRTILAFIPQDGKDNLAAYLINSNQQLIAGWIMSEMQNKHIQLKIKEIVAEV